MSWRLMSWPISIRSFAIVVQNYHDVIMGAMASQITSLTIVYSTVYSSADRRKYKSPTSLAIVRGLHRWPVNSPHKRASNAENVSIWWRHHEIWGKFHLLAFVLSLNDTATVLLCSRQKFLPIYSSGMEKQLKTMSIKFELWWKNRQWNGPWPPDWYWIYITKLVKQAAVICAITYGLYLLPYGPLARYVKLLVADAPGMPGTFSPLRGFLGSRWRRKRSRHSRRMRNPQLYVSDKRPMLANFEMTGIQTWNR